ncbi:MAG: group III truncated hemoglobin [Gemmatimonadetes bacterium]|nr:group III truncated hemoglobin [Gemmatimonadota bacterium]NNM31614.1 group III truncated hemoglobin [Gemmatimonadota bacterium]
MQTETSLLRATFTRPAIRDFVLSFYGRVRADPMLGPVFEARIEDWDTHLERMQTFWGTVLRAEPGYVPIKGPPPRLHARIPGLTVAHYDRWLELFHEVIEPRFEPWAVENIMGRARRIAMSFSDDVREEFRRRERADTDA